MCFFLFSIDLLDLRILFILLFLSSIFPQLKQGYRMMQLLERLAPYIGGTRIVWFVLHLVHS